MKFLKNIKSLEFRLAESMLKSINDLKEKYLAFSDEELKNMTNVFKEKLKKNVSLESIRIDAFAVAREATFRVLKKRPYDVQMIGGLILDFGSVAEMKTGEGKTITSIAPVYLNALKGSGVIVSTVNEYLAERDAAEMGEVFKWLGLSVGLNKANMPSNLKRAAYKCDITYSVHSELGFDYLRDNMVNSFEEKVQRDLNFALIDEVDSILIDEAKTPLIISGGKSDEVSLYAVTDQFVRTLDHVDYAIDEETKAINLTAQGIEKTKKFFNFNSLYNLENSELIHRLQNALRAHKVMKKDVEYVVLNGKIELVDTFTGRIMEGRSYSEGLQQAIQAKELVEIDPETKTLATITYQNFFRLFKKLSGMTGTGKTEEQEFIDIYNMRVTEIPTNVPIARIDHPEKVYVTFQAKYKAVVEEIKRLHAKKQPILVGTSQVEESEYLHQLLLKENLPHTVLNAKQNKNEADIIAKAGIAGAITIATNMAGRGTDIKPDAESLKQGGLFVLGTDKSEARRIDNQLKGRSGRQGDVGESRFFISIDDQLIRRFSLQDKWKEIFAEYKDNEIIDKQIKKAFDKAQRKIEGFNYDNRKNVLNYDDVIRQQRDIIYSQRDSILLQDDLSLVVEKMIQRNSKQIIKYGELYTRTGALDHKALVNFVNKEYMNICDFKFTLEDFNNYINEEIPQHLSNILIREYRKMREFLVEKSGKLPTNLFERRAIISALDEKWQNHINLMDKLRQSVNLVQYSQKNPFQTYTEIGTKHFEQLVEDIATNSLKIIMNNPSAKFQNLDGDFKNEQIKLEDGSIITIPANIPFDIKEQIISKAKELLKESGEKRKVFEKNILSDLNLVDEKFRDSSKW
ncbi:preprotein translocase subunit SecA [[Mycoplasma] mobile]|uniref:Protein translocase subunit SecA n=1 Tax=Mycoplasma mobile (strain ATCC 43663 / 163K / NCTC 11711) TaxID=267748 RepID=SECA_MYCM1|nr:preprotein translocase subunit SecA [[Mycoplasma] mobile]Q6KIK4.1 RecName: Full=Protein translocase subunit SecA [Mycoplasma mobile 163K]AAT27572.1 preprotein translocase secA subunit [Mycoplasma mobile 163K]